MIYSMSITAAFNSWHHHVHRSTGSSQLPVPQQTPPLTSLVLDEQRTRSKLF